MASKVSGAIGSIFGLSKSFPLCASRSAFVVAYPFKWGESKQKDSRYSVRVGKEDGGESSPMNPVAVFGLDIPLLQLLMHGVNTQYLSEDTN